MQIEQGKAKRLPRVKCDMVSGHKRRKFGITSRAHSLSLAELAAAAPALRSGT